jgi:hypothetical protein
MIYILVVTQDHRSLKANGIRLGCAAVARKPPYVHSALVKGVCEGFQ